MIQAINDQTTLCQPCMDAGVETAATYRIQTYDADGYEINHDQAHICADCADTEEIIYGLTHVEGDDRSDIPIDHKLIPIILDGAAIAYAQMIGERDYESAGRLAERIPSVLDGMGTHDEVVARRDAQHKAEMDKIQGWCQACGYAIYTRSKHVPDGADYHRNCYRA